jgi:hypothetical protein
MKPLIFKYYSDPGHGWFAVKRSLLATYVDLKTISHYSYQRGQTVYLEEDCDCSKLFKALDNAGIMWGYVEKHTDKTHPIRSYNWFTAGV